MGTHQNRNIVRLQPDQGLIRSAVVTYNLVAALPVLRKRLLDNTQDEAALSLLLGQIVLLDGFVMRDNRATIEVCQLCLLYTSPSPRD